MALALLQAGCSKDFLDKKPNSNIVIPATLADMRGLLENETVMWETPSLGELSTNDYVLETSVLASATDIYRNAYVWAKDIYGGIQQINDWNVPYRQVLFANIILAAIDDIPVTPANEKEWRSVKGAAYFMRGRAFHNLVETFALPYDLATAGTDPGIPLRLTADINARVARASVQQTYAQIEADLSSAAVLLGETVVLPNRLRPTKLTAWALLSRMYLCMRDYPKAGAYADSVLAKYNTLIDYNSLNAAGTITTFSTDNTETLMQSNVGNVLVLKVSYTTTIVEPSLYALYDNNDLRKTVWYKLNPAGQPYKKSSYTALTYYFSGIATDEMYLIRAEAQARAANTPAALADLNALIVTRYKKGTFVPLTAATPAAALSLVLLERRKELAFRGLRWLDIRRLNKEGANITMSRTYNGQRYDLPPNNLRFALPIPDSEIAATGIEQNQR